jgi:UDPglucose--hexose-1-phosphate uridylyltransferase
VTIRTDALTGAHVAVASHRQERPNLPTGGCPFCVGGVEAPDPYDVRSFVNRWPSLGDDRCEVVLFSPDHEASLGGLGAAGVRRVVDLWAERTAALGARPDIGYVLVFENRGADAGATISHPHGQIYAYPDVPDVPACELDRAARDGCALCAEVPGDRLVSTAGAGEAAWQAWVPWASPHPYGLVLAPERHLPDLPTLDDAARDAFATVLADTLSRLDRAFGAAVPYMLWVHQQPAQGGPWPQAHVHAEIVPLWRAPGVMRYVAGAELGSGWFVNSVDPDDAAATLRAATDPGAPA